MTYQSQISLLQTYCETNYYYLVILEYKVLELREYIDSRSLTSPISRAGLVSPSPLVVTAFEAIRVSFCSVRCKIRAKKLRKKFLGLRRYIVDASNQNEVMQVRYEGDPDADPALRASLDELSKMSNKNYEFLEKLVGDITQLLIRSGFKSLR